MPTLQDTYTPRQAEELLKEYPYFTLPALLALKRSDTPSDELSRSLAARVAMELPDIDSLHQVLAQQAAIFDNFYPDGQCAPTPDTIDTIDTFLATFGKADERETDALTKRIFSPVPDYAATLATEERLSVPAETEIDNPALSAQDRLINGFIARTHAPVKSDIPTNQPIPEANDPESVKDTPKTGESTGLTESFVRVLVKNGNYAKAIEIISELNLKNPKKSSFFANRIEELKVLTDKTKN